MQKYLLLILSCISIIFSMAQFNGANLDDFIEKNKKPLGEFSIVMLYKDGKIQYKKKIGEGYSEKTVAPIGAASRWLTAALVLQFVDEGKLSLDAAVTDYLPDFGKYGKKYITIRHCLTDLTGIEAKKWSVNDQGKFNTLEEMVNSYAKKEIRANAGTDFWFGDYGICMAARVVEVIGKKGFEQLMMQKLLRPLGMKNTSFSPENNRCVNPASGAASTANDYMNFLIMLLNKGNFNGKQILSEASVQQLLTAQFGSEVTKAYQPKDSETFDFTLGGCVLEKDAEGKTLVAACPNFMGIWPVVDVCRNYALLIFPGNYLPDAKKQLFTTIKNMIDDEPGYSCK